jgi:hypothetical protein
MAARVGQIGHVGVEVLATAAAVMLRIEHDDVAWPPSKGIAQVMEGAAAVPVAVGTVTAMRAAAPSVVAALDADLSLGQVLDARDPGGGITAIFARS